MQRLKFDNNQSSIIVSCYDYYRQSLSTPVVEGKAKEMLSSALSNLLTGLCQAYEGQYPGWEADTYNPGYMITLSPPKMFRVPFHLLAVFPGSDVQDLIWTLASKIKTTPSSILCLSGSNAIRKMLNDIGDMDFCEYIIVTKSTADDLLKKATMSDSDLLCVGLKMPGFEWGLKSQEASASLESNKLTIDPSDSSMSRGKLDFIAKTNESGAIEATNVTIFCDKNGDSASLSDSFAYQEAPISLSDWIPQRLDDCLEMGRYVDWLCTQITYYLSQGNVVKALKRASSLSRICFLPQYTDEISDMFERSTLHLDNEISRINRLISELEDTDVGKSTESFLDALLKRKQEIITLQEHQKESARDSEEPNLAEKGHYIANELVSSIQQQALTAS